MELGFDSSTQLAGPVHSHRFVEAATKFGAISQVSLSRPTENQSVRPELVPEMAMSCLCSPRGSGENRSCIFLSSIYFKSLLLSLLCFYLYTCKKGRIPAPGIRRLPQGRSDKPAKRCRVRCDATWRVRPMRVAGGARASRELILVKRGLCVFLFSLLLFFCCCFVFVFAQLMREHMFSMCHSVKWSSF